MAKEFTKVWFRMLVLVLSFSCIFIYGFWTLLIFSFDEPGQRFIPLLVPVYFLTFFSLEILADRHPKLRALGFPILLLVGSGLILARDSLDVWEGLAKPLLIILAILGFYSMLTSYKVFKRWAWTFV